MTDRVTVTGSCHCGAVRFEAQVERRAESQICNCSICRMCGFQHLIVPANRFRLISGEEHLREYRFKSKTARHLFCATCSVKSFYVPRSNPDGFSLNVRCLSFPEGAEVNFIDFDGRNWSRHAAKLRHLSEE